MENNNENMNEFNNNGDYNNQNNTNEGIKVNSSSDANAGVGNNDDISKTVVQNIEFTTASHEPINDNQYTGGQNYTQYASEEPKQKKTKTKKNGHSAKSYVAVALICSLLGGGLGAGATYGLLSRDIKTAVDTLKNRTQYSVGSSSNTATALTSAGSIDIPSVVEKVSAAVVGVSTTSQTTNYFGFGTTEQEGLGSGVIFSEDGYVLTNYHVVKGANSVKVILSTGQEVEAKVVNYDENADLAVVKVTEDMVMPAVAELGDSNNVKVGEQVVAIGNPLGKEYLGSVTTGIISALSRDVQSEDGTTMNLMQTDTAINAGNSGGPLLNAEGQVIGINTAKLQATGVEGMGFAIPINDAIDKLDVLVKQKITLGITCVDITEDLASRYNLPQGIYIQKIQSFSIAEKGGLQTGDVITKFGGKDVKTVKELNEIKAGYNDGDQIEVEFIRNGKTMTATLTAE